MLPSFGAQLGLSFKRRSAIDSRRDVVLAVPYLEDQEIPRMIVRWGDRRPLFPLVDLRPRHPAKIKVVFGSVVRRLRGRTAARGVVRFRDLGALWFLELKSNNTTSIPKTCVSSLRVEGKADS